MRPNEIITPRLRLGPLRAEDRDILTGILTDPRVSRTYMVPDLNSEEEKTALFERLRDLSLNADRFVYGIFRGGRLIGMIHEVDKTDSSVELGYFISPGEQGRGYASEALKAAADELLAKGWAAVEAAAFTENPASLRVMEKCGMTRSNKTETLSYRGADHLCNYYQLTKESCGPAAGRR